MTSAPRGGVPVWARMAALIVLSLALYKLASAFGLWVSWNPTVHEDEQASPLVRRSPASRAAAAPTQTTPAPRAAAAPARPQAVLVSFPIHPRSEEIQRRAIRKRAAALLAARKFGELDRALDALRSRREHLTSGAPKLSAFYGGLMREPIDPQLLDLLQEWREKAPRSPGARIASAMAYVEYAWQARGSGTIDTVTPQGAALWRKRCLQAARFLDEAQRMTQSDPALFTTRMEVALGGVGDRKTVEKAFSMAVAADPNYYPAYWAKAWYLTPRWYGEPGEALAVADASVAARGGDLTIYARLGSDLLRFAPESGPAWARLDRAFRVLEKQRPDDWVIRNFHARSAYSLRDDAAARPLFAAILGHYEPSAWENDDRLFREVQDYYVGRPGSKEECAEGLRYYGPGFDAMQKGEFASALASFNQSLEHCYHDETLIHRGHCLNELGRYDEAMESYWKAYCLTSRAHHTCLVGMAESLEGLKSYDEALGLLKLAAQFNPSAPEIAETRSRIEKKRGGQSPKP